MPQIKAFYNLVQKINNRAIEGNYDIAGLQNLRQSSFKYIFSGHSIFDRYAFHTGGSGETQFNIGVEGDKFRYGIAFSLQPTRTNPIPVETMGARIKLFNEFIKKNKNRYPNYKLYFQGNSSDKKTIPDEWIHNDEFIFFGKKFSKKPSEIGKSEIERILSTLDDLLELYLFIESGVSSIVSNRIARVCWNENGWQYPSGPRGKSKSKNAFEFINGYGHEEWMFDYSKLIDGYKYAYLQPVGKHRLVYEEKTYNISLYGINSETNYQHWVGKINNVSVLTKDEQNRIYKIYKKNGWIQTMREQVTAVSGDVSEFDKWTKREGLVNIKFKPSDAALFCENPEQLSENETIRNTRYLFLHETGNPVFDDQVAVSSSKIKKEKSAYLRSAKLIEPSQLHDDIQIGFVNYLKNLHSKDFVDDEWVLNYGGRVDIYRKSKSKVYFYEVKAYPEARSCIREAFGQLMEYCYYKSHKRADELIIVSQAKLLNADKNLLKILHDTYGIPLSFIQFDPAASEVVEHISYA